MGIWQETLKVKTHRREEVIDITRLVEEIVKKSGIQKGVCHIYVQGATAGILIQENCDNSVQEDFLTLLREIIPRGKWLHDAQDGNGDAHLKSALIGPSESVPIIERQLGLSTWQNIFLCEFDGPREERKVVVTVCGE